MKKLLLSLFIVSTIGIMNLSGQTQAVQLEFLQYRNGTHRMIYRAQRQLRLGRYDNALLAAEQTLYFEPRAREALWVKALAHSSKREAGLMMEALAQLGIREASESLLAQQIVTRGSRGYVLSNGGNTITMDYGSIIGTQEGDEFIVYAEGEALQHPITMQILYVEKRPVAQVRVIQTLTSHSIAEITMVYDSIEPGMRVVPKEDYDSSLELSTQGS